MAHLPWNKIQTVLLDMDGTLLDLHFDSYFWLKHLPETLAKRDNKSVEDVTQEMRAAYHQLEGKIEWYCLDYWAQRLNLDMMQVKREIEYLISFRPDAIPFIDALKQSGRKVVLVTNAHPDNLLLKVEKTQLDTHIDELISTHQFGVTKESQLLWQRLQEHVGFDPSTTLFVDDSQVILDAAKEYGVAYTLGINNPDSQSQHNNIMGHPAIIDYMPLLADIIDNEFSKIG